MTFGERVKQERKKQGMTQQELADTVGVSKMTIRRIEAGQTVTLGVALDISDVLHFSSDTEIMDSFRGQKYKEYEKDMVLEDSEMDEERALMNRAFDRLNRKGRKEARKRVEELAEIPRYTETEEQGE